MIIKSLELKNFRNYQALGIAFDAGTNILYGDNAQGKTNILEAVYVCSTTKSHRGSKDKEIIRFGADESHIKMMVRRDGIPYRIDMHLKKNKAKGVAVNGVPIKKASELFGIVNVIFFSPEDLNIIKNGPAERRRFVDLELCQLNRLYVYNLAQYNKIGGIFSIYELLPAFIIALLVIVIVSYATGGPSKEVIEKFEKVKNK